MNKKGFTLIEILAVIVIIGIIATIGIVSISGSILKSRDATVVDLAQVYAEGARSMRAKEEINYEPKSGEAIIVPYSRVTSVEVENNEETGYGKIIDNFCYVGVVNDKNNYLYYVTQVDESYHILDSIEYNSIDEEDILEGFETLSSRGINSLKAPYNGMTFKYANSNYSTKAVRVEFQATISANQPTTSSITDVKVTEFGKLSYDSNFVGYIKLYKDNGTRKVELNVVKSAKDSITKQKYTFVSTLSGGASTYVGEWKYETSNNTIILDIKNVTDGSVSFDVKIRRKTVNNSSTEDKVIYGDVVTTNKSILYGQFYSDNKYNTSNVSVKGSIADYDSFETTGKFSSTNSKEVTYDGVKYVLDDSDLMYIIAKKN